MRNATSSPAERDLEFAISAAREAGERALKLRETGRWKDEKILGDVGDQASDGYLQGLIRGRYPDDGLLSEETADSPARLSKERVWIVDPLDGTKEFGQGRADWAVHVALTKSGRCLLGAVALPSERRVLWGYALAGREHAGIEGGGALARGDAPQGTKLRIAVSRSHTPEWTNALAHALGPCELVPWGSAGFKVSRLALGEADLYVHSQGLKEWDTCAPETVARALGWSVCRLRGDEHSYNRADPKNHELVICRPAQKQRVLAAIAGCGVLG
jgi:3'(2'), 5'-bisphosphate nucleotidase